MDLKVLAAAKSYTNNAIAGVGAIKGAPCQIQSIEDIEGGHRVTFLWIDNNSQSHTSTMDVMDGAEGARGPQGHPFEIKGTYATASDLISAHPTGEAGDAYSVVSFELCQIINDYGVVFKNEYYIAPTEEPAE